MFDANTKNYENFFTNNILKKNLKSTLTFFEKILRKLNSKSKYIYLHETIK